MTLDELIDATDELAAGITQRGEIMSPLVDGQTVALLEKAAERVAEAGRLLRTVAAREGRRAERDVCEHGVTCGDWCEPCNAEYKRAAKEHGYEEPGPLHP